MIFPLVLLVLQQLLCRKEKANKMTTVALRINTLLTRNSLKRNSRASIQNGMERTTAHYQAILFMYKQLHDALIKKHAEELEVARVQGKLELFDELFNMSALSEEKEKIESELVLAEAKAADVKVPYIDWYKLNEPQMFD
ncbi:unnamed protein product [Brassica oleracea]